MTIGNGYHTAFVEGIGCAVIFRNGQDVHLVKRMDERVARKVVESQRTERE